jgi:hypothetical protein
MGGLSYRDTPFTNPLVATGSVLGDVGAGVALRRLEPFWSRFGSNNNGLNYIV